MKLVRRQTRRYRETQKLKGSTVTKTAVMGATVAIGQFVSLGSELGANKAVYAASAQQAFINDIAPLAQELASKNDLYASVMVAQAILESSWGTSSLATVPNYNLFGIKGSYNGMSVTMPTLEDNGSGKYYRINDNFRKYPSYYESLNDYVHVLKTTRIGGNLYYRGAWRSQTNSYLDATKWLTGRYATDTAYAGKLNNIIQRYQLTRFDGEAGGTTLTDSQASSANTLSNLSVNGQYIVKAGDTLWSIATKSGMSVSELKQLNHLSHDNISVGQVLKLSAPIPKTDASTTVTKPVTTPTAPQIITPQNNVVTPTTNHYVVKAGDTLWRISNNHGTSVETLKQLNGLSSDMIYVGQHLKVNGGTTTTPTVNTVKPVQTVGAPIAAPKEKPQVSLSNTHTVQPGDTLWRISNRNGLTVSELKRLNGLNSDMIYVGQVLTLAGGTTSTNTSSPSTAPVVTPTVPTPTVAKPTVTTPATSTSESNSYTVKAGETLWRISNRYGMTVDQLKALNGLTSNTIYVGQVLSVKSDEIRQATTPVTPTVSGSVTHTVQAGETLWRISNRHGLSVEQLKQLNQLTSNTIYVGQQLKLK